MSVSTKTIHNKIDGILNTKKITKAMEMISIAKMRKIEILMNNSRPYLSHLKKILYNIQQSNKCKKHIFLNTKKKKNIIIIIISTERGLCGSLNTNLFKKVINKINSFEKKKIKFKLVLFGTKSFLFFKNFNYKIIKYIKNKGDKLKFNNILKIIKNLIQMYKKSKIDHIYVANNYFKNKLSQIPRIKKILPLLQSTTKIKRKINYIYEPKSISLFNFIFKKFIFTEIYQSFLENLSCEQAARMLAMKNATDNSNNMVENLRIIFNKARQFNVTQELNEIVSGASAIL